MGNDILRLVQRPFHDCAKYVLNSFDSQCEIADCCSCKLATHEVEDDTTGMSQDSPILVERQPP